MALNPPMYTEAMPMSKAGEMFLCTRPGIAFEVATEGLPKLRASKGNLFLTTLRVVFVATPPVSHKDGFVFTSFELPLDAMTAEKFNQPIFGANNLSGTVSPIPGMGLQHEAKFKLIFNNGGAGTFLGLFFRALVERRNPGDRSFFDSVRAGTFSATAVADPNDPSTIYVTQPDVPVAEDVQQPSAPSMAGGK